ncbi:MAG TPA: undecaprenyl-diphosphate phosphatase [Gemmatimonadaceae bacterium]|jgi:undecaprenyl-diphosphatase|nr:undecaprenyl-diphosphate phosphatase [Gemmatimonadaceae bacterium]
MTPFQATVLGIIQGLSEFLPISSSAHLTLVPWLLGWEDPGLAFDVALHFGTLLAVLWYFRMEWLALIRAAFGIITTGRVETPEKRKVVYLIIATIPGAIGGLILQSKAESAFRSPQIIAIALIVLGTLLWIVDKLVDQRRILGEMRWIDSLLIGLSQVIALIPGVSRSGATITTARGLRFDREAAAEFSFLMSMPIIAAAVILEGPKALHQGGLTNELMSGVVASAISGWLAISILMRYVSRHSYGIFAAYRILLGIAVLAVVYARG